jgi:tetratricopeptide (TPR) repeat protein
MAHLFFFATAAFALQAAKAPSLAAKAPTASSEQSLERGRIYGSKGQWQDAERELRSYRNTHPDSVEGIMLHAESLIQLNQPFDAALELQKFLQSHPDAVRPLELHASLAADKLRDKPLAQSELEKVTKLAPKDSRAWRALAQIYIDQGDWTPAIPALKRAALLTPQDAVVVASLGYVYGQTDDPKQAAIEFNKALQLSKNTPKDAALVEMLYGRFLLDSGQAKESVALFDASLKFDPRYASGFYWRARAYQALQKLDAAEADALESIRLDPHEREAPLLLVSIYRKQGNTEKAQEYADMVKRIGEEKEGQQVKGRALRDDLNQAEHLLLAGNFAEAATRYESILQTLPTYYEAYFDVGMCYSQTGRPGQAEEAFRKYLKFQPVSSDGRAALGILLLSEGRGSEAIPELEQAIQIDPSLIEARKALAAEYLRESKPKSAIVVLQSEAKSPDKDLQLLAAEAYLQLGEWPSALRSVDRALAIAPGDPESNRVKQEILSRQREKQPKPQSEFCLPAATQFG